jgi:hypothetical protein
MLTGLELGEHLAGGSFSDVYKGLHGGQDVAIKMMRVFGKRNTDQVLKVTNKTFFFFSRSNLALTFA